MPDGSFATEPVKITLRTLRDTLATIYTETQGQFEFSELKPDNYQLEAEGDRQRFEAVTENVQVFRSTPSVVTITLKPIAGRDAASSKAKLVSVYELTQNIPKKARREFDLATLAGNAGKTEEAIAHLRKAIGIFPNFVRAYNDLGTYLLAQGKLDEAIEVLRKATSLDEKAFNPTLNLAIVLVHKQQFTEAADILAKALALEPASPAAHLYAGLAFIGLEKSEEAERELRTAYSLGGQKYALALFHLGQLTMNRGENDAALRLFQDYLNIAPDAPNADQVRKLIAMLRPKT